MATNWKNLTSEQKEAINAKRREKYAQLPPEAKAPILEGKKQWHKALTSEEKEERRRKQRDAAKYDTNNWIARLQRKVDRHKANWWRKVDRIQKWADEGGKYPWPSLQDKCAFTEAYFKALHVLGRKCDCCGTTACFDNYWRLTRKDDFLAFLPRTVKAMKTVVAQPYDYEIFCLKCARDMRLYCFAWIFSPINGRDGYSKQRVAGPEYAKFEDRWHDMYPPGWHALTERIKSGKIRSLTCQIIGPDGRYMDTIIRMNRFYYNNGDKPQPIMWVLAEQLGQLYNQYMPHVDTAFFGAVGNPSRGFYAGNDNLVSEGFGAWLESQAITPPLKINVI